MWLVGLYNKPDDRLGLEEFRQIFLDLYPDLCLYALSFVGDYETSKDIVQEVLARFWADNNKLLNKNLVKPYLYKSVKNRALNYKKREKRKVGLDDFLRPNSVDFQDSEHNSTLEKISVKHLREDLEKAMSEMPEQRRKIFQMSRMQQMKHKEIAAELNLSPKTVETQIYRSLNFLREKLKHYFDH